MLALEKNIIESHDDYSIWYGISAGFDDDKNFIVVLERTDYDNPRNSCKKYAVVYMDEAYRMARRQNAKLTGLPDLIYSKFGEETNLALPAYVRDRFDEILGYISSCGVRYTLRAEKNS